MDDELKAKIFKELKNLDADKWDDYTLGNEEYAYRAVRSGVQFTSYKEKLVVDDPKIPCHMTLVDTEGLYKSLEETRKAKQDKEQREREESLEEKLSKIFGK